MNQVDVQVEVKVFNSTPKDKYAIKVLHKHKSLLYIQSLLSFIGRPHTAAQMQVMALPSPTKTWHSTVYPSVSPSRPELSVAGKVVLITGGGSGLGPHIAHAFATAGSTSIVLVGRTLSTLQSTAFSLKSSFPSIKVLTLVADIVDKSAVDAAFAETKAKLGPIDILVSNAAYFPDAAMIGDAHIDEWWKGVDVNLKGSLVLVQAFLKNMAEKPTILHVTTAGAHLPAIPSLSGYAVSQLAGLKFFEYVAAEYPEVRVMNIHPGAMDTAMGAKGSNAGVKIPMDDSESSPLPRQDLHDII